MFWVKMKFVFKVEEEWCFSYVKHEQKKLGSRISTLSRGFMRSCSVKLAFARDQQVGLEKVDVV